MVKRIQIVQHRTHLDIQDIQCCVVQYAGGSIAPLFCMPEISEVWDVDGSMEANSGVLQVDLTRNA